MMCDFGVGQMPEPLDVYGGDYRGLPLYLLPQHIYFGHDLLSGSSSTPSEVLNAILDHHERLDGTGYPRGLKGDEIGQLARMTAICDEFDYLVAGGFHRPAIDPADAITQLQRRDGELDQLLIVRFIESVGVYPIGTCLELESGRVGMVVGISPFDTSLPTVRIFYSLHLKAMIRQATIDLSSCYGEDRIVGVADLAGHDVPDPFSLRAQLLKAAYR